MNVAPVSPRKMWMSSPVLLGTARSSSPSSLKSANVPRPAPATGNAPPTWLKLDPSPPLKILTSLEVSLATARSRSASLSKSATPTHSLPLEPGSKLPLSVNVEPAAPVRIVIWSSPRWATARSGSASPLKSPVAMSIGPGVTETVAGPVKAAPAAPVKSSTWPPPLSATARSASESPLNWPTAMPNGVDPTPDSVSVGPALNVMPAAPVKMDLAARVQADREIRIGVAVELADRDANQAIRGADARRSDEVAEAVALDEGDVERLVVDLPVTRHGGDVALVVLVEVADHGLRRLRHVLHVL